MKNRTSSKPQRRLTKLVKEEAGTRRSRADLDDEEDTRRASALICASYESLTTESRQRLREQFTATFPEVTSPIERSSTVSKWSSTDKLSRFSSMGRKDKAAKIASTLTLSHAPIEEPCLSPAASFYTARPTQVPDTIDVEAAISLLQELRKRASPEELVALHRALLPVKEIEPVSPDPQEHDYHPTSEYRRQFASKRRSNMPPGLATRGGPEDDPLRRYSDLQRRPVPARRSTADVVPDQSRFIQRPQTPLDSSGQAGVYQSGTLRITNGCASPVSSMHFSETFEVQEAKEIKIVHTTIANLGLVKELEIGAESSDESTTLEDSSPIIGSVSEQQHHQAGHEAPVSHLVGLRPQPERTNTAMRDYNEFRTSPYDRKVSNESHHSSARDSIDQQFLTPKASMADFTPMDGTAGPPMREAPRPELMLHADSGYGSESSNGQQVELSKDMKSPIKLKPVEEQRWLTALPNPSDADQHSLYTFEQIVKSPSILGATRSPSVLEAGAPSPQSGKAMIARKQTLFSSLKLGKSPSSKAAEEPVETTDSIETIEVETAKKSKRGKPKKLKKTTPSHIKQARKELKRLEEAALADAESRPSLAFDRPSREQASANTSVEDNFRVRAPHAYARIQAAGTAFEQQEAQRARSASYHDRELQTAMSDETDGVSIINFGAVARSLGASPYDISTCQFKESIDYIEGSEDNFRIQSPFEIGHGIGPRTQGMNEKAASELARSKSRDLIESDHNSESAPARPRGPRKPVLDRDMPPLPPLPSRADEQVGQQLDSQTEQKVLIEPDVLSRGLNISEKPITTVDWEPQARIWRERRAALDAALHAPQQEEEVPTPAVQIKITEHHDEPIAETSSRLPIRVDTTRVLQAQAVLADARAAIKQRVPSPVSPMGEAPRQSWSRQLSPVSHLSTPTSAAPSLQTSKVPRPTSRTAATNPNSGRFSAEYLAQLNAATPPQLSGPAPYAPGREFPLSTDANSKPSSAVVEATSRPSSSGRPLSALLGSDIRPSSAGRPLSAVLATPDRYSGGFQYEWQRDVGVMGSAGTRVSMVEGSERSMPSKVAYGLDFSDIPLFVQKQ